MKWNLRDKKTEEIKKMLYASKQDFKFDADNIKSKILLNIREPIFQEKVITASRFSYFRFATIFSLVAVLIIGSGTTLALADGAKPGDKLYSVDLIQEKVIFRMLRSEKNKAEFKTNIAIERHNELQTVKKFPNSDQIKIRAVFEAEKAMTNAIDDLSQRREKLLGGGHHQEAKKVNESLKNLEEVANDQEQNFLEIEEEIEDEDEKHEIEESRKSLIETRSRVRMIIKIESEEEKDENKKD